MFLAKLLEQSLDLGALKLDDLLLPLMEQPDSAANSTCQGCRMKLMTFSLVKRETFTMLPGPPNVKTRSRPNARIHSLHNP